MAAIDWDAAITALNSGDLPCSGGERRILQLSASLAAGTPVSLRDTVTGLDDDNTARLLAAIQHATGTRCSCSRVRLADRLGFHRRAASLALSLAREAAQLQHSTQN